MTDADAMLEDCLKRYHKLNEWERGFIDSLSEMGDLDDITINQYERLETIWEKVT